MIWSGVSVHGCERGPLDQLRAFDPDLGPFDSDAFLEDAYIPELREPVSRLRNEIPPLYGMNWRSEPRRWDVTFLLRIV